jgi:hypothetical protein
MFEMTLASICAYCAGVLTRKLIDRGLNPDEKISLVGHAGVTVLLMAWRVKDIIEAMT